jgi:hypothetical protein
VNAELVEVELVQRAVAIVEPQRDRLASLRADLDLIELIIPRRQDGRSSRRGVVGPCPRPGHHK